MIIHTLAWLYVGHFSRQWPSQSQASIITKIVSSSENDTSCGLASLRIVPIKSNDKNKIYILTNSIRAQKSCGTPVNLESTLRNRRDPLPVGEQRANCWGAWMRSAGCNCESRQPTEVSWSSVKYIFTHQVSPFLQQGLSWFLNLALSLLSFWYGYEKWLQVDIARFSVCVLYPTYINKIATMPLIWFVSAFYVLQK